MPARILFFLPLLFLGATFYPGSALAENVGVFARNALLDGKVVDMTFDQGGRRFWIVFVPEGTEALARMEMTSRPGRHLYEMRHQGHLWTGRTKLVGVSGYQPLAADLKRPGWRDELKLFFVHNPLESHMPNAARGYTLLGFPFQWIMAFLALAVGLGAAFYRRDRRAIGGALFLSLAGVWAVGEAVTFNDHWGHVRYGSKNANEKEWRERADYLDRAAIAIGQGSWSYQTLDGVSKVWSEYRLADKRLQPLNRPPPPDFVLVMKNGTMQLVKPDDPSKLVPTPQSVTPRGD